MPIICTLFKIFISITNTVFDSYNQILYLFIHNITFQNIDTILAVIYLHVAILLG